MLEQTFKKYDVEARAPTLLLNTMAEILASQSIFLTDMTPEGVLEKIRSLQSLSWPEVSETTRGSIDQAMEEILEALTRDEAMRLLLSTSAESNSLGQLVLGSGNRNEYLETLRVYMADETSKSFMVSVADTTFELLQRVLGKIPSTMKNVASGYALWEVPFNLPGKQTMIGMQMCPVVLKRAWQRPTKIYFLTNEEATQRFSMTASAVAAASTYTRSAQSSMSSQGSTEFLTDSSGESKDTLAFRASSSSTLPSVGRSCSVKVFSEDGTYVMLILSTKTEKAEAVKRRALSKFGQPTEEFQYFNLFYQPYADSIGAGSNFPSTEEIALPTTGKESKEKEKDKKSKGDKSSKSNITSPSGKQTSNASTSSTPGKGSKHSSNDDDYVFGRGARPLTNEDDVAPLLVKYGTVTFLLRISDIAPARVKAPTAKRKAHTLSDRIDSSSLNTSHNSLNTSTNTSSAASTAPIGYGSKELRGSASAELRLSSDMRDSVSGRRGSFSLSSKNIHAHITTHATPDLPSSRADEARKRATSPPVKKPQPSLHMSSSMSSNFSNSDVSESSESTDHYSARGSSNRGKQQHTVFSKARTFQLSDLTDVEIERASAASYGRPSGPTSDLSDEEKLQKVLDLLYSGAHRTNLSLQGFNLSFVPVGLRDIVKQPRTLDLSHNRLTTLPDWFEDAFDHLRGLILASNAITSFDHLEGLRKLHTLDLSANKIRVLPNVICGMTSLQVLYLNFNELSSLPKSIGKLTGLRELAISGNGITELPASIAKLTSLSILDIGYNRLRDAFVLHGLTRLTEIYAPSNEFYDLSAFYALSSLEVLDLSCTQITDVPKGISRLLRLTVLNLSRTPLSGEKHVHALKEMIRMPSLVATHWPPHLEYLTDTISNNKSTPTLTFIGGGDGSNARRVSVESGTAGSEPDYDFDDEDDEDFETLASYHHHSSSNTITKDHGGLNSSGIMFAVPQESKKPKQLFAVPAAGSPESTSPLFAVKADPLSSSSSGATPRGHDRPDFLSAMSGSSGSRSNLTARGGSSGCGTSNGPFAQKTTKGSNDGNFVFATKASTTNLSSSGASMGISATTKKRRKSGQPTSPRRASTASSTTPIKSSHLKNGSVGGFAEPYSTGSGDKSGGSSSESSPRRQISASAAGGLNGKKSSTATAVISKSSGNVSGGGNATIISPLALLDKKAGSPLSSANSKSQLSSGMLNEVDAAAMKRRNYSQRRFSTMGDVIKTPPVSAGTQDPSKMLVVIDKEGCEGFTRVEQSRGVTERMTSEALPEPLSFQPANLRLAHGLDEYFTHFYDQNHVNFIAIDKNTGVMLISVLLEKEHLRNEEAYRLLIKSQSGDKTIWLPSPLLFGKSASSSSLSSSKKHSPSFDRVIDYVIENQAGSLQITSVKQMTDPAIPKEILEYESRMNYNAFKFGVLYAGLGSNEDEYYSNTHPSIEFENFLEFLGDTIRLQGWPHFSGGLDVNGNRTGRMSVYKRWASLEIMFHISTLLPFSVDDPQQIERKKHLGNDVVVIVFQDEGAPPFHPSAMKSYFNHVYLVIRPLTVNGVTKFTMATASKDGVLEHSPLLPEPTLFDLNADFRRFLYTKLVNAERSSYEAPNFSKALCRTRLQLLQEFSSVHATNASNKKVKIKHKVK